VLEPGGEPVTNRLSYGTALVHIYLTFLNLTTLPITLNEWVTVRNESEGMWQEAFIAYFHAFQMWAANLGGPLVGYRGGKYSGNLYKKLYGL
jgi:hypothetical protein